MSPASKSKSKDKKGSKEMQKGGTKPLVAAGGGSGIPASAYNPVLGTFHALELSSAPSASSVQSNGRFRNIDDSDDHSSLPAGMDYDSVSNNGSWSGESEDHKDKSFNLMSRQETIPGADNDKREKIRQKNEKKHQRQKEKRAQELHERCTGYLMSRKLESLAQQLVSMGFSQERATMALIQNEGRVEESVAWLFDGGEEADKFRDQNPGGSNLKIDISEEIARIADLENRYKCSKQEVERAVVSNEGDLEKAAETLRTSKVEAGSAAPKLEETGDPAMVVNGKGTVTGNQNMMRFQGKEERDFNYTKQTVTVVPKRVQAKMEWAKPTPAAGVQAKMESVEKRWSSSPGGKSVVGVVREPVIMMQRPKQVQPSWYPPPPPPPATTTKAATMPTKLTITSNPPPPPTSNPFPMYHHTHQFLQYPQPQHPHQHPHSQPQAQQQQGQSMAGRGVSAASSLGLFSGLGTGTGTGTGSTSGAVDWNTGGSMLNLDYANIDWTLDRGPTTPARPNGGMMMMMRPNINGGPSSSSSTPRPSLPSDGPSSASYRDWTSPFEAEDLFSLPRQFVSSPSL